MSQFSARSENLLGDPKPPIFGTKLDFFPIVKTEIQNFPKLNNFISLEPHMSQFSARSENLLGSVGSSLPRFALVRSGEGRRI